MEILRAMFNGHTEAVVAAAKGTGVAALAVGSFWWQIAYDDKLRSLLMSIAGVLLLIGWRLVRKHFKDRAITGFWTWLDHNPVEAACYCMIFPGAVKFAMDVAAALLQKGGP